MSKPIPENNPNWFECCADPKCLAGEVRKRLYKEAM